jgi:hypothetical protein
MHRGKYFGAKKRMMMNYIRKLRKEGNYELQYHVVSQYSNIVILQHNAELVLHEISKQHSN